MIRGLWWESRRKESSRRIGLLTLMVAAMRLWIASFLALGFNLIGIASLLSRQMAVKKQPVER